ncbi:MAG TPA: 6-carboxytetrahydropterin synthase [Chitinophagaceae bacterium]|nr:6-carboxytetrahydropterin synthase [Chitinophagaceae bacterium]
MLSVTKIFHFESAHALLEYPGLCKNIHGHSYVLQVTVSGNVPGNEFIPSPGFFLDFKELKQTVKSIIIEVFDHKLILSRDFLTKNPDFLSQENLVIWDAEPTAENLLIYIQRMLSAALPLSVKLAELKLYETQDSFAKWVADN